MKPIARTLLIQFCYSVFAIQANASTCVATKAFKVKEVCGKVVAPFNEPVARATVELLNGSEESGRVFTDDRGEFLMPDVAAGQYEIRVQSPRFVTAAQKIIVMRNSRPRRCQKPLQLQLTPGAMGCSTVSK